MIHWVTVHNTLRDIKNHGDILMNSAIRFLNFIFKFFLYHIINITANPGTILIYIGKYSCTNTFKAREVLIV